MWLLASPSGRIWRGARVAPGGEQTSPRGCEWTMRTASLRRNQEAAVYDCWLHLEEPE